MPPHVVPKKIYPLTYTIFFISIHNFNDPPQQSQLQALPPRLLMVFFGAELPGNATTEQSADFLKGERGALLSQMCANKLPYKIAFFQHLLDESAEHAPNWRMVFLAVLSGPHGCAGRRPAPVAYGVWRMAYGVWRR